jgi:SAM-dependent methyltransferase
MGSRYQDLLEPLRTAYDRGAENRDVGTKAPWKLAERAAFLHRIRSAGMQRLLEIGAGTGQDSVFFRDGNLEVIATDLSPAMIDRCRAKGLDARVMDFMSLDFPPGSFDAVYAMNCILHVPNADLPAVLDRTCGSCGRVAFCSSAFTAESPGRVRAKPTATSRSAFSRPGQTRSSKLSSHRDSRSLIFTPLSSHPTRRGTSSR